MDFDIEEYESQLRVNLGQEYQDVSKIFRYIVITAERLYLCNKYNLEVKEGDTPYFYLSMEDAWVWDTYLANRFIGKAEIYTFSDVNIEELKEP